MAVYRVGNIGMVFSGMRGKTSMNVQRGLDVECNQVKKKKVANETVPLWQAGHNLELTVQDMIKSIREVDRAHVPFVPS